MDGGVFVYSITHGHRALRHDGSGLNQRGEWGGRRLHRWCRDRRTAEEAGRLGAGAGPSCKPLRDPKQTEGGLGRGRWERWGRRFYFGLDGQTVGRGYACVEHISRRRAENQLCAVPVLPRPLLQVDAIVKGHGLRWLPVFRGGVQVIEWRPGCIAHTWRRMSGMAIEA